MKNTDRQQFTGCLACYTKRYKVLKKTVIKQIIILIVMLQIASLSYGQKNNKIMKIEDIELFQKSIEYPYQASEKRKMTILNNMNKLEKGMTKAQVIELMTLPDDANLTYDFKKANSDNVIGFSLVYLLRRNIESGSGLEKNEKLLRIHFDNYDKIIWSHSIDIDGFRAIEKE
ncbi:hypothetical protein [Bizionia arctica]|uniref:Uncharacterized protein n=1 Tax=Bizionia arctica TaxID=1495645 RepID=A0A917GHN1_9FLAO|nr:hypothetical protein [Bizionia arctica]GGG46700.1 hypothetical protein GCM10010976_17690 [Bizionia arctica]